MNNKRQNEFEVALSYASEDRGYVGDVADHLVNHGVKIFYDRYEQANTWGKDLYEHFSDIYANKANYTVMFISEHYRQKMWTNVERRAAQSRAIRENREYILPARFDDTEIPGLLPTIHYVSLKNVAPAELSIMIMEKLGRQPQAHKAYAAPPPRTPDLNGDVDFIYSSHNGRTRIGSDKLEFEIHWSKYDKSAIRCYADTPTLRGVAAAPKGSTLTTIPVAENLDFTSRFVVVQKGEFVVLENIHGFFAALRIIDIKDNTRNDEQDLVNFKFWILRNGTSNFSTLVGTEE